MAVALRLTDEGTARSAANIVILPFCRLRGPSSVNFVDSFSSREKPFSFFTFLRLFDFFDSLSPAIPWYRGAGGHVSQIMSVSEAGVSSGAGVGSGAGVDSGEG